MGDSILNPAKVTSRVIQGSVIGPLLFILFINRTIIRTTKIYADDRKLYRNLCLNFNSSKIKVLWIGKKNTASVLQLIINDKAGCRIPLTLVDSERDLDIIVDPQLKFYDHTQKTISKVSQLIRLIRQRFKCWDNNAFVKLCKGIVRSTIENGNVVLGPHYKTDWVALEKVQRHATKLPSGLKNLSYEDQLFKLNIPTLK
ncbi:hypothetical protein QYM36_002686 [Artemia franciscana]|uniref:Reverse transcriptase domain-containing protein n=1 Tax=Artemia franciscana TaxID=6661 RepID=A0AA88I5K2_ARTSF|nr:hypothetical protein QYM36_002686 [Artemia franciscana]